MRKTIASLAAAVATMAAFGSTAGPAAADDPNARQWEGQSYFDLLPAVGCDTQYKRGVLGQYGASGYYIDGCTTKPMSCPARSPFGSARPVNYCRVYLWAARIETRTARGDQVTMNARQRTFSSSGQVIGWSDKSCAGINNCTIDSSITIVPGQSATAQCNGVREAKPYVLLGGGDGNSAQVSCSMKMAFNTGL